MLHFPIFKCLPVFKKNFDSVWFIFIWLGQTQTHKDQTYKIKHTQRLVDSTEEIRLDVSQRNQRSQKQCKVMYKIIVMNIPNRRSQKEAKLVCRKKNQLRSKQNQE